MKLLPRQQRVVDEKAELDAKLANLDKFINSDKFLSVEQSERKRLVLQAAAMRVYSLILADRIASFPVGPETANGPNPLYQGS